MKSTPGDSDGGSLLTGLWGSLTLVRLTFRLSFQPHVAIGFCLFLCYDWWAQRWPSPSKDENPTSVIIEPVGSRVLPGQGIGSLASGLFQSDDRATNGLQVQQLVQAAGASLGLWQWPLRLPGHYFILLEGPKKESFAEAVATGFH